MSSNPEATPSLAHRPRPARLSLRAVLLTLLVAAVVFAAVVVVPLAASLSWALVAHYECGPGTQVASELLWTPLVLVNSPYGGFANGTGTFPSSGGFIISLSNGSSAGSFEQMRWNISTSVRVMVAGPGANAVCTGFLARIGQKEGAFSAFSVGPPNATSDSDQNTTATPLGVDSVIFHNAYVEADRTLSTCSSGPMFWSAKATEMVVDVPFPVLGGTATVSATLEGTYNYTYTLPGHFGTWNIDDLNAGSNAPGGGWAFQFVPCG